jgi:branched-chain amino acid transport system substrate-binding protein
MEEARLMTVQFQGITSTNLDDFRDGKGDVVLWPEQYKAGEAILPYSEIKH